MKKLIIYISVCIEVVICYGCNQGQTASNLSDRARLSIEDSSTIVVASGIDSLQHIAVFSKCTNYDNKLSKIASEVRFIPLGNEPPISEFHSTDIELTEDFIFLSGLYHLYQYDWQGHFIQNIGQRGMGPADYVQITPPLQIDYIEKSIYALDINRRRVVIYNFDGTFNRAFQTKCNGKMTLFDANTIVFQPSTIGEELFLPNAPFLSFTDRNGKNEQIIQSHIHPVIPRSEARVFSSSTPLWEYAGRFYSIEYGSDTIFRISRDEFVPAWILTGELKLAKKELFLDDIRGKLSIASIMLRPNSGIFESNRFLIFRLADNKERFFLIYDKVSKQFHRTYEKDAPVRVNSRGITISIDRDYFIDDLVSGLHFDPQYQSMGKAIALIPATTVVENRAEILLHISSHPSEESTRLKAIVEKMDEFDNPLVMIVTFK